MSDCAACSRHRTALNIERTDLLRAKAHADSGRMDPDVMPVFVRRVLAATIALEDHQAECPDARA